MAQTVKIAMRIDLDIDAEAWAREYGIAQSDVRADVRRWVEAALHDGMAVVPTRVEVK